MAPTKSNGGIQKHAGITCVVVLCYILLLFMLLLYKSILRHRLSCLRFNVIDTLIACDFLSFILKSASLMPF